MFNSTIPQVFFFAEKSVHWIETHFVLHHSGADKKDLSDTVDNRSCRYCRPIAIVVQYFPAEKKGFRWIQAINFLSHTHLINLIVH